MNLNAIMDGTNMHKVFKSYLDSLLSLPTEETVKPSEDLEIFTQPNILDLTESAAILWAVDMSRKVFTKHRQYYHENMIFHEGTEGTPEDRLQELCDHLTAMPPTVWPGVLWNTMRDMGRKFSEEIAVEGIIAVMTPVVWCWDSKSKRRGLEKNYKTTPVFTVIIPDAEKNAVTFFNGYVISPQEMINRHKQYGNYSPDIDLEVVTLDAEKLRDSWTILNAFIVMSKGWMVSKPIPFTLIEKKSMKNVRDKDLHQMCLSMDYINRRKQDKILAEKQKQKHLEGVELERAIALHLCDTYGLNKQAKTSADEIVEKLAERGIVTNAGQAGKSIGHLLASKRLHLIRQGSDGSPGVMRITDRTWQFAHPESAPVSDNVSTDPDKPLDETKLTQVIQRVSIANHVIDLIKDGLDAQGLRNEVQEQKEYVESLETSILENEDTIEGLRAELKTATQPLSAVQTTAVNHAVDLLTHVVGMMETEGPMSGIVSSVVGRHLQELKTLRRDLGSIVGL